MIESNTVLFQNVTVNILDSETKQIIPFDFVVHPYPFSGYEILNGYSSNYWVVRGGSDTICMPILGYGGSFLLVLQNREEIEKFGYIPEPIEGNNYMLRTSNAEPEDQTPQFLPRVLNVYLRKKDSPNA